MDDAVVMLTVVLPLIFMAGGVLVILMAMYQRTKTMEMKHRERMAMIDRGLAPGPENDPAGFESWQQHHERPPARSTSIGVVIVSLGVGLMLLIGVAGGAAEAGVGVGGAIVVIGAAFIVNGELQRRSRPSLPSAPYPSVPPPPAQPGPPPRES